MTSYRTRKKLTFTLTARPVTVTWTHSWAFSVICTYTIVQAWITVAWIHWNNKILYTKKHYNTYVYITITLSLSCSIHCAHFVFERQLSRGVFDLFDLAQPYYISMPDPNQDLDFQCHISDLFCVQWFEERDGSFSWYLWSCLPSLFIRGTRQVPLVEQKALPTIPEHPSLSPV